MPTTNYTQALQWASVNSPWALAEAALQAGCTRLYLVGTAGVGKTHLAAKAQNREVYQITETPELSVQEQIGHLWPDGDRFIWHDGPITKAWREGARLVVNEFDRASIDMQRYFYAILDNPEVAELTLPTGEKISPAPGFELIATSNNPISVLEQPLQDRFEVVITVSDPHPQLVERLNQTLPNLGTLISNSYKDPGREVSPRKAIAFASLIKRGIDAKQAAVMTFGVRAADFIEACVATRVPLTATEEVVTNQ